MDLRTSMPEFHDFADALHGLTPKQRDSMRNRFQILSHYSFCMKAEVRFLEALDALIHCVCAENDLAIG